VHLHIVVSPTGLFDNQLSVKCDVKNEH
jgi:hypothetical protein